MPVTTPGLAVPTAGDWAFVALLRAGSAAPTAEEAGRLRSIRDASADAALTAACDEVLAR